MGRTAGKARGRTGGKTVSRGREPDALPLEGRVALVSGSTSGIGRAIALALLQAGARVVVTGLIDAGEQPALLAGLRADAGLADSAAADTVRFVAADMRAPAQIAALVQTVQDMFGTLDILVNNAGIQHVAPIEEFPPEAWQDIIAINLSSNYHAIRHCVPAMRAQGWGRIVNIASAHGLVASPFKSAYVAAKHGVVGLSKTVALELAESGVTCNAICPGFVQTPMVDAQIESQAALHNLPRAQVVRDVILASQPSKTFVQPEQVAAFVVFLCSAAGAAVTGAALTMDGGWTAR